jgi:hypothetical protein
MVAFCPAGGPEGGDATTTAIWPGCFLERGGSVRSNGYINRSKEARK